MSPKSEKSETQHLSCELGVSLGGVLRVRCQQLSIPFTSSFSASVYECVCVSVLSLLCYINCTRRVLYSSQCGGGGTGVKINGKMMRNYFRKACDATKMTSE